MYKNKVKVAACKFVAFVLRMSFLINLNFPFSENKIDVLQQKNSLLV